MRRERPDDKLVRDFGVHGDQYYFRGLFESSFWQQEGRDELRQS